MAIAESARVEVPAALWRRQARGELSLETTRVLLRTFEHDLTRPDGPFAPVRIAGRVLARAAELTGRYRLTGRQATDLSAAIEARRADESCSRFATLDPTVLEAAVREGFDPFL